MTSIRSVLRAATVAGASVLFAFVGTACSSKPADPGTPTAKKAATTPTPLPGQDKADLEQVVADIGGEKVTVGELQDRINKQSPYVRARYTSMEQKKEFLENLVRFEVLAKEAQRRGYDQDPEVVRTMKQVMIQRLMKEEFDTRVKPDDVTEEEMRKFYEAHHAEYNKPEEVRVSAIIMKDKAAAKKAFAEAKAAPPMDNKAFRDLVTKYSEDTSKERGGDLRFFAADTKQVPAEVVKAAFNLQNAGELAGPVQTEKGWYVIKQTGRRKAINKTFDEVKRQIQNRIYRDKRSQAMEDFVKGLREGAKIQVHEAQLSKVRVDTSLPNAGASGLPTAPAQMVRPPSPVTK